jgi:hypothetical protein
MCLEIVWFEKTRDLEEEKSRTLRTKKKDLSTLFRTRHYKMEKEQENDKEESVSELFCFV